MRFKGNNLLEIFTELVILFQKVRVVSLICKYANRYCFL